MATSILKLNNLTKTFILGNKKNAKKAQKALQKLQNEYEKDSGRQDKSKASSEEKMLRKAQELFASEKFEESYESVS
jgi:protein required for attachment to host cells